MFDRFYDFILTEPQRLIGAGRLFARFGMFLLLLAAIGHAATGAAGVAASFAKRGAPAPSLADLYPAIPTWFVAESVAGCIPAVVLIALGFGMVSLSKQVKRHCFG